MRNTRLSTPAQLQCLHYGAWEPGNTLLQASVHPHTSTHSHMYGFVSIAPRLPASEHKHCKCEGGESNFSHFSDIKGRKGTKDVNVKTLRIAHGYTLGFRTAKTAIVHGNLLTYLASAGQPYTKQLNV